MTQREAADRLNFMPNYVTLLERDDYQALRSPSFARGYVKSYGRLLGVDERQLLAAFDRLTDREPPLPQKPPPARPPQLQRTGVGVVTGLGVLALLVAALWWWEEGRDAPSPVGADREGHSLSGLAPQLAGSNR